MKNLNLDEALPCRCGGKVQAFGPNTFAPKSHWGLCCSNDNCQHMVSGDSIEEAIESWNQSLEPIHA